MVVIIRQMGERDYKDFRKLFEEAYSEYLEILRRENPQRYLIEQKERREVSLQRFDFYLKTGTSFVAEEKGKVVSYVTSQTLNFLRGIDI